MYQRIFLKWIGGGALAGVVFLSGIAVQRVAAQPVALVGSSTAQQSDDETHASHTMVDPDLEHTTARQGAKNAHERPHGDRPVILALIKATVDVTGLQAAEVRTKLRSGASIEGIVTGAGKTTAAVLASYDTIIDKGIQRAVQNERLPQSLAAGRAAWFKQSARLQIDQPALQPRFPGLHELHVVVISAAVRVSDIPRADLRADLETCKTLTQIVATKGKTSQNIVDDAMAQLAKALQTAVDRGNLTTAQRDEWQAALLTGVTNMVNVPGLHVAGKECAS